MNYNDTDLVLRAGAAAGLEVGVIHQRPHRRCAEGWTPWDPLKDDGDALRLSVKLRMNMFHSDTQNPAVVVVTEAKIATPAGSKFFVEPNAEDPYAAARRAIVRAASARAGEVLRDDHDCALKRGSVMCRECDLNTIAKYGK